MSENPVKSPPPKISHRKRYQQILSTFIKHGFGYALAKLQLKRSFFPVPPEEIPKTEEDLQSRAVHFRLALEELGPTFIKVGQILSTRPDLFAPEFIQELTKLEDSVRPESWETIQTVLFEELGEELEQIFPEINPVPLASASLGQVHSARLKNGRSVVIKIQRPNIENVIEVDLSILGDLAALAERTPWGEHNHPVEIIDAFAHTLRNELDYFREGRNADRFRENFLGYEHIYIPTIYWEHTTRRVLVMEELHGIKITEIAAIEEAGINRKNVAHNAVSMIVKEVLEDGFYHADPHGGNYFVLQDGTIGVMDFGMVGELSSRDRQSLTRLYINAIAMDAEGIVDELFRMNAVPPNVDRERIERDMEHMLQEYAGLPLKEMHFQNILQDFTKLVTRYNLTLSPDFWLLGKTLGMMEGIGLLLYPELDIFAISEPIVRKLRREMLLPKKEWIRYLVRQSMDWEEVARLLPRATRRLVERIDQNRPLDINLIGREKEKKEIVRGLNQLSFSILIASLVLAIALLLPIAMSNALVFIPIGICVIGILAIFIWLTFSSFRNR